MYGMAFGLYFRLNGPSGVSAIWRLGSLQSCLAVFKDKGMEPRDSRLSDYTKRPSTTLSTGSRRAPTLDPTGLDVSHGQTSL